MIRDNSYFPYDPLQASCSEIRLLMLEKSSCFDAPINCKLQNTSLNERPDYEALSYVWGDSSDALKKDIYLQQQTFWITPNLESALRHLRLQDRARVLWVDSICINQNDLKERAEQVRVMGNIYRTACHDLLWIGADTGKYSRALSILAHEYSSDYTTAQVEFDELVKECDSVTWSQLLAVFEDSVWQRMWIVQELLLAKEIRIICGFRQLSSHPFLFDLASALISPRHNRQITQDAERGCQKIVRIHNLRSINEGTFVPQDLLVMWYHFAWSKCRDPRDKIFALLDIVNSDISIEPDYTVEAGQLFNNVTRRYILQHRNLNVLGYVRMNYEDGHLEGTLQHEPIIKEAPLYRLPSWSLDFGSDSPPYCPRFLFERVNGPKVEAQLIWNSHSSQLLETHEDQDQLPLLGVILDKAIAVTESTRLWPEDDVIRYYFYEVIDRLAEKYLPEDVYFNGDTILDSYWKTICTGLARKGQDSWDVLPLESTPLSIPSHKTRLLSAFRKLLSSKSTTLSSGTEEIDLAAAQSVQESLRNHVSITTSSSSFCITERGYMALVPDTTRTGDYLCVLRGGCTPFALRPADLSTQVQTGDESMTLVGSVYVHGLMDDLPMKWLQKGFLKERRFILV